MHKIFDLREMDIEQLHSLAEELKIKGYKKLEKDKLIYDILDEEAKLNAQNAPEKPKRGRPRKEKAASEAKEEMPVEKKEKTPVKKTEVEKKEERSEVVVAENEVAAAKEPVENTGKKKGKKTKKAAKVEVKHQEADTPNEQIEQKIVTASEKQPETQENDQPSSAEKQPRQKRARIQKSQPAAEPVKQPEPTPARIEKAGEESKHTPQQ